MFGVEFSCYGGTIQSRGFQIIPGGRFQFLDELIQLMIHRSLLLYAARNSPATARAAPSKRTSAKSTKAAAPSTSTTETSATPGSAAVASAAHPRSSAAARPNRPTKEKPEDETQHRRK